MTSAQQAMNDDHRITMDTGYSNMIVSAIRDPVVVLDPNNRTVYTNDAYQELFSALDPRKACGLLEHMHDLNRQQMIELLETVRRERKGCNTELTVSFAGLVHHFETEISIAPTQHGDSPLLVVFLRNANSHHDLDDTLITKEIQLQGAQAIANFGVWEQNFITGEVIWSAAMKEIFGVTDSFIPSPGEFLNLVHPLDRDYVVRVFEGRVELTGSHRVTYRILRADGEVRMIDQLGHISCDDRGQLLRNVGVCLDITNRRWNEERIRSSEEHFRMMVDNVREYSLYLIDENGHVTSWNKGAERIKGYSEGEILGQHYSCFYLAEHVERGDPEKHLRLALQNGQYEGEGWRLRKSGARFWAHFVISPLLDDSGKLRGYSKITHDITDRRRVEDDLRSYAERLRVTSGRLAELQESERRALAGELHDRVGPNLTALGLNISLVAGSINPDEQPELVEQLETAGELVRATVEATRNVMEELRPHLLDDFGLVAALRPLVAGFQKRTGIVVTIAGSDSSENLPKPVVIALFRIAQEALNNVAKHSRADRVIVSFSEVRRRAILMVEDDGVGVDIQSISSLMQKRGWGLTIMRERAEAVGAHFTIGFAESGGTRILVEYRL